MATTPMQDEQEAMMTTPRHSACVDRGNDCEIIVVADARDDGGQLIDRVRCRREALAGAAYFVMLFARAQATAVKRESRSMLAYKISVPFDTAVVVFLLRRLHCDERRGGPKDLRCDLAQAVGASLFFGMSPEWIECLVLDLLRTLTERDSETLPNRAQVTADRSRHNTASFALCLLESDLVDGLKKCLWQRFAYLLPVVATAPFLGRGPCYNAHAASATVHGDDGALWHAVRLAFDALGHGTDRAVCANIELSVSLAFENASECVGSHDNLVGGAVDRHNVILSVHSAPAGERPGDWPRGHPFPVGALHVTPCAMRVRVRLYHPTCGLVVDNAPINSWSSAPTATHRDPETAGLRRWGVPMPHGFDRRCRNGLGRARRAARTSTIATGVEPRDRALWACEVALFLRPLYQG
ncbi:hypothetical protein pneo_cds_292 [Pandoravirus neocaledonia]|uniref:BTB domain containing protein n=1 Tax=Pandoravirus neocaledonia TaxID=2107708 RepID=A0A2U7UBR6_9VIRU|nr:hypothetical protein pneo_cds_292 [Pandoravirus neocaledonia]AVK75899.1 hypothetical protein pneo_cds_292 [Pandoravirus neocaledonia]